MAEPKEEGRRYEEERRVSEIDRLQAMARLTEAVENLAEQFIGNREVLFDLQKDFSHLKSDLQKDIALLKEGTTANKVDYKSFLKSYDKQIKGCAKVQDDHETRLRALGEAPTCHQIHRLEVLEFENKDQYKNIYKILGILLFIIPIVTLLFEWGFKKITG